MSIEKNQAESSLARILSEASGFDLNELDKRASFLELGFDSLFLIQFTQKIKSQLKVKVTFRQLIEEIPTIEALIDFVAKNAPSGSTPPASPTLATPPTPAPEPAPAIPAPAPVAAPLSAAPPASVASQPAPVVMQTPVMQAPLIQTPVMQLAPQLASQPAGDAGTLAHIISQQNQLMSLQLQLLSGISPRPASGRGVGGEGAVTLATQQSPTPPTYSPSSTQTSSTSSLAPSSPSPTPTKEAAQKPKFERFGPYKPVRRGVGGGLTDQQQQALNRFMDRFTQRTTKSRAHAQLHRAHFADPRGVAGYRRIWKSMVYQISVERSAGSKLWDVDGNEYIDIAMGFGLNLFGQSPEFVTQALHRQLDRGVEVGPQSPLAGEVAQLLCDFSRKDRVTFCNTGSEAVMAAMRLARTVTGKSMIVFFNKDYHGNFDEVLLRSAQVAGQRRTQPAAPGVPQALADNAIVLDYGTPEALQTIRDRADEIAAVLVEPVQSADPFIQPREFLHEVRRITQENDIALIMDEVISGFRAAPGGAQEWFDVWGDMSTYGKVLGGGLPIGALAGSNRFMDALDGGNWRYEDDSEPTADMTFFAGTFVRHPLAMAAAHQILMKVKEEGPDLQERLTKRTTYLVETLNQFFHEQLFPFRLAQFTSLFRFMFPPDLEYADLLYFHLLERGIFTRGWADNCFLSTAHSDADIERIIEAVKSSCLEIREGGFMPRADDAMSVDLPSAVVTPSASTPSASTPPASTPSLALLASGNGQCTMVSSARESRVSTLEEIQPEGSLPPLFCMPAADGLTLVYHDLADELGEDQPIYGLTSPGVYGEEVPLTIEEMAARFVEDIREFRPKGPYNLIGYCSGGTIAFEAAQQLVAAGEQVALVAGIETYDWGTAQSSKPTLWTKTYYNIQRAEFHLRNFLLLNSTDKLAFLKSKWERMKARSKNWRDMIRGFYNHWFGKRAKAHDEVSMHELWRQHDAQADRYRPKPFPGKLLLIRPRRDYRSYVGKEDLRALQGVRVERIPAYPAGLMTPPYVAHVARIVKQAMRDGLIECSQQTAPVKHPERQTQAHPSNTHVIGHASSTALG